MAAVLAALLAAVLAPSPGTELALQWDAPPECPQGSAVREAIDANLGEGDFDAAIAARGTIVADGERWRLDVEVTLSSGRVERSVVSRECAGLADAAGLIIAVALDPLRVVHTVAQPPPVPTRPIAVPQADEVERPQLEQRTQPRAPKQTRSLAIEPRIGGVLELGALGLVRGGIAAGVGLVGPRYRIDFVAHYLAPRAVRRFDAAPDAGVSVQQAGVGARACVRSRLGPVELPTCLGFEAGVAVARGIGLGAPHRTALPWAAVVIGQELTWVSRRRLGVFVGADAMVHVVRPRFRVSDLGTAARTGWVGVRFVAGPVVRI
ncbi:MAG TPA: hypothetical protein VG755_06150 [Nannocystaceae bacterium]|nr:hypothetical protein [Nannocystaceae bacterium]